MARTEERGKRGRRKAKPAEKPIGPPRDPDEEVAEADEQGQIKPLRPDKAWVRQNRVNEPEEA